MKPIRIYLLIICLLGGFIKLQAQSDSVQTEYKTEDEKISRSEIQRVIRYITRANVEEKTLIKIGGLPNSASFTRNAGHFSGRIGIEVAVERKMNSSFSILLGLSNGASLFLYQRNALPPGVINPPTWLPYRDFSFSSSAKAAIRYYYNMAHRIKTGKSANNFSGTYIAVQAERPIISYSSYQEYELVSQEIHTTSRTHSLAGLNQPAFTLQWGIQQRLGRRGYVDINAGPEFTIFDRNDAVASYYNSRTQLSLQINATIGFGW